MMAKDIFVIDAKESARQLTMQVEVRVVNLRWVKMRLWLAVKICRFAAWIGGIGLEINQEVGVLITESDSEYDEFLEQEKQEIDEILEQLNDEVD
ncbi:MAG: hypothetical protein IMY80_02860 [Chloroflexi bacterium]|nr:hypothetical protein [Chloroflexota bacterium]